MGIMARAARFLLTTAVLTAAAACQDEGTAPVQNTLPEVASLEVDTDEDRALRIELLASATDVDGDTLTLANATQPAHGALVREPAAVTYTPDPDYHGPDGFDFVVSDGSGTVTAAVAITVNPVNDAPRAFPDTAALDEDEVVVIDVLANDDDIDGDSLRLVEVGGGEHGTAARTDAAVEYSPDTDFSGLDSLFYVLGDGHGGEDTAVVSLTVRAVNDPPLAADDHATTDEDRSVRIPVLANDTDPEGGALTVDGFGGAEHGTVVTDQGGLTYIPAADFAGEDGFTYDVRDEAGAITTGTVTLTVIPVADPPVAVSDSAVTPEDTPISIDVLANDGDADGDALALAAVATAAHGSAAIQDGRIRYVPGADYVGSDAFDYVVADGTGRVDTASVVVAVAAVNDAPIAGNDAATVNEDESVAIDVLSNDDDPDGDSLAIDRLFAPDHGSISQTPTGLTYIASEPNYHGSASLRYIVTDPAGATDTATVAITINPVNDAPVAVADEATMAEDGTVLIDALSNDTDVDGDSLMAASTTYYPDGIIPPSHGTASWEGTRVRYTPDPGFNGADSLGYWMSDGVASPVGGWVRITVTAVSDAPVAVPDRVGTLEDTPVTFDPRENDTDEDGDALEIVDLVLPSTGGLAGTPTFSAASVTYTPDPDANGTAVFGYVISDGTAADTADIEVSVAPVNDAPVAADDSLDTPEDIAITFDPRVNDSDPDDATALTIVDAFPISQNFDRATFSFTATDITLTPDPEVVDSFVLAYVISDGEATDTAAAAIHVTAVNDPPVAGDDAASGPEDTLLEVFVLANDTDSDNDLTTDATVATLTPPTPGASITLHDGGPGVGPYAVYNPAPDFNGTDSWSYEVHDGMSADTATVTVTITAVNDAPMAGHDARTVDEDGSTLIDVLANDTDADGDPLTITSFTSATHGTVVQEGAQLRYTPDADFNGTDSLSYHVEDGKGGTSAATVSITVNPVNDAPVATPDAATTLEDEPTLVAVLANDSDAEGDALAIAGHGPAVHGTVAPEGTRIRYTPDADWSGTDAFTYSVGDGNGGADSATVTITVTAVNDPPVGGPDSVSTTEDQSVLIEKAALLANDRDPDNGTPTLGSLLDGAHGTLSQYFIMSHLEYVPDPEYSGPDTAAYVISDPNGALDTVPIYITVSPVDDPPTAAADSAAMDEDGTVLISVLANDGDPDMPHDSIALAWFGSASNGAVAQEGSRLRYTPDADFPAGHDARTDTFSYAIRDGAGQMDTTQVSVTVSAVNDAPVAVADAAVVPEDGSGWLDPAANDSDADGDIVILSGYASPAHGTIAQQVGATLEYRPAPDYFGSDTLFYTSEDGYGATDSGYVAITITSVNDAPVGAPDSAIIMQNGYELLTVLANDSDPDGDPLSIAGYSPARDGMVAQMGDDLQYVPDADFIGFDSFTYDLSDGTDEVTADVTVAVQHDADYDLTGEPMGTPAVVPFEITHTGTYYFASSYYLTSLSGTRIFILDASGSTVASSPTTGDYGTLTVTLDPGSYTVEVRPELPEWVATHLHVTERP